MGFRVADQVETFFPLMGETGRNYSGVPSSSTLLTRVTK